MYNEKSAESRESHSAQCILLSAGGFQAFNSSSTFTVPANVTSLLVLCVGGGAAGAGVHFGGPGSGNVSSGTFAVTPGSVHSVTVAGASAGGAAGCYFAGAAGGSSSFGSLLSCSGGSPGYFHSNPGSGGSGGGAACVYACTGGSGGTNGAAGQSSTGGASGTIAGGSGQGSFAPHFAIFTQTAFSAGAGGVGVSNPADTAGSGGGGVLMNGTGPSGGDGSNALYSGRGGQGYGGGGGSGGCDVDSCPDCDAGGNGASGLVYVEWNPRISSLAFLSLFIHSLLALVFNNHLNKSSIRRISIEFNENAHSNFRLERKIFTKKNKLQ